MVPCPHCGSPDQKVAYAIREGGTTLAIACARCEHIGPEVAMTFPPNRADLAKACALWDVAPRHNVACEIRYLAAV